EPEPEPELAYSLDATASFLNFVSSKKTHVLETHRFDVLSGGISTAGEAQLVIDLNSVNTGIDVRNGRMRDYLFETATYSVATVTVPVDLAAVAGLAVGEDMLVDVSATLDLHGVPGVIDTQLNVQRLSATRIMVQNQSPLLIKAADYSLEAGIETLRNLASLNVISTTVPVDFVLFYEAP
ncbi:YceI family protein, partial [Saccharophagus degradans]